MYRKYQFKRQNNYDYSSSSLDISWIQKICEKESSPDKAINLIISHIEAQPFYYECVNRICYQLTSTMKHFYKESVVGVQPFGSAVTTLALKSSDVDVFVDFKEPLPSPPAVFAKTLRNKISKNRAFSQSIAIPARVPVVQCKHQSGISCDVSFLNGLGVCNSNLIKFLIHIDDRIRPLTLILKFLLKKKGLTGVAAITSYAIVILVIFFLQQLEEPLLPSISYVQSLSKTKKQIAGWETSFVTDSSLLPQTTNKSSISELLKQFFEFYSTFEFGFYVISSFTGKTYTKPFFNDVDSLPEEYSCYKQNLKQNSALRFECDRCMCVQGPFNHSHNITRSVTLQVLEQFQSFCNESKNICLEAVRTDGGYKSEYLKKLFLISDLEKQYNYKKFKSDENTENVFIRVGTNVDFSNASASVEILLDQWTNATLERVKDILDKIMKCEIEVLPASSCETTLGPSERVLKVFSCELQYLDLITKKRKKAKQEVEFPEGMSLISQEEKVSNYLCETFLQNVSKIKLKFLVVCILHRDPTHMCLSLNCKEDSRSRISLIDQVFRFVKSHMPKYFNKYT